MKIPIPATAGILSLVAALLSPVPAAPRANLPPDKKEQPVRPQESAEQPRDKKQETDSPPAFRIDQPGTITFTVGMVVKGKIDKPQVIIFLPKEKTFYRDQTLTHSFADAIKEPLPFSPIVE